MKLNHYLYATQYYRSPTPLPNEWDGDLENLGKYNLNTIQIRINWRNNERKEDVYVFDDIDRLMELSVKHHKKVIIKFLLECAPQYIFDKYGGTRIGPRGEQLRGGSHGAFYAGGWLPCFTNPKVKERMVKFVKVVTERYCKYDNIILWNAWNEPRNKPIEECYCPSCRKGFGEYLKNKFVTIENLNEYYGTAEESFEHIALPAMPHGYWDMYEFKKFKSEQCIYDNLKAVYDAIRCFDKTRPVISHSGYAAAFQNNLGDNLGDNFVSKAVDMWGTSVPCDTTMDTADKRLEYNLLNDYLRSISKDYIVYEIYPGLGMYKLPYDTNFDMDYKLYCALGSGAKGINFWQYRSERVGHENDCAGLARMDGTPRPVLKSVKMFGDLLNDIGDSVLTYYKKNADVAILFDYDSLLLSEIQDCSGVDYHFENFWNIEYYTKSHKGFYRLMKRHDIDVDYVQSANVKDIHNYKVIYVPDYEMARPDVMKELAKFVKNGGILIADEGFALRDLNTWVNPYDMKADSLLKGRLLERRRQDVQVVFDGNRTNVTGYHSTYNLKKASAVMTYADGEAAVSKVDCGKGSTYLFGFSLGYNSFVQTDKVVWRAVKKILKSAGVKKEDYSDFENGIEARRLAKGNSEYIFITNDNDKEITLKIKEKIGRCIGGSLKEDKLTVSPKSFVILKTE